MQGLQDRRRKLTDEQKSEIQKQYATGNWSLSKLGAASGVSKKTVLLLVNPDSAEKAKEYRKENWKEFQPTREERTRIAREHRQYKQRLYLSCQLVMKNTPYII